MRAEEESQDIEGWPDGNRGNRRGENGGAKSAAPRLEDSDYRERIGSIFMTFCRD